MSDPFQGEIRIVGFNFAPQGWAFCDGQLLGITQNSALFSLLGTQFGGNGTSNFALPNLQNSVPIHQGQSGASGTVYVMGETAGAASVALTTAQMPNHTHPVNCQFNRGDANTPVNNTWAVLQSARGSVDLYATTTPNTPMAAVTSSSGQGQAHDNMSPYLAVGFCIALVGIYPARN